MNANQLKSQIIPILNLIGLALVIVAAVKFAGIKVPIDGNIHETVWVGIGLLLAK
jgi:hypothetical protein